jgi:hypothetical protein
MDSQSSCLHYPMLELHVSTIMAGYIVFLFMAKWHCIVFYCMDISQFVYSFTIGDLGCFYFLLIMNGAGFNMCTCTYLSTCFSIFNIFRGVKLLGLIIILCLTEEMPDYFPQQLFHFTSPQKCVRALIPPHHYLCLLFSV